MIQVKEWLGKKVVQPIKTWGLEWVTPYVEEADSMNTSKNFRNLKSGASRPSPRKEPEPVDVERADPPHDDSPKLSLMKTRSVSIGSSEPVKRTQT